MKEKIWIGLKYGAASFFISFSIMMLFVAAGYIEMSPLEKRLDLNLATWLTVSIIVLSVFLEEFILRFIPLKITLRLTQNNKIIWSVVIAVSFLFGALHGSFYNLFIQGIIGIMFSAAFLRGGYVSSVTAHLIHNLPFIFLILVYG